MKLIHIFGTFDVGNYGDLLFPIIARHNISNNFQIQAVSPTSKDSGYTNTIKAISIQDTQRNTEGVLLGGGNILHFGKGIYGPNSKYGYADIWFGSHKLALKSGAPHFYNNPGCMLSDNAGLLSRTFKKLIQESSKSSLKTGVRDSESFLNSLSKRSAFNFMPDTAFHISKMWPCQHKYQHISINLNHRYFPSAEKTAQVIDDLIRSTKRPVDFTIIGECHGDEHFTDTVIGHMVMSHRKIIRKDLKDIAMNIATAQVFIGSSMHGFITALSYETNALLVNQKNSLRKFESLWNYAKLNNNHLLRDFTQVLERIEDCGTIEKSTLQHIIDELDDHWSFINLAIEEKTPCRPSIRLKWYRQLLLLHQVKMRAFATIFK